MSKHTQLHTLSIMGTNLCLLAALRWYDTKTPWSFGIIVHADDVIWLHMKLAQRWNIVHLKKCNLIRLNTRKFNLLCIKYDMYIFLLIGMFFYILYLSCIWLSTNYIDTHCNIISKILYYIPNILQLGWSCFFPRILYTR